MPKAYWIAHVTVTDPEQYKLYAGAAPEAFTKYGAVILARGKNNLAAADFMRFLKTDKAVKVMRSYGYEAAP